MLIIYILLIVAFINICQNFHSIFYKNAHFGSNDYNLDLFVQPITRVFNAFKYKKYNSKYKIKSSKHENYS